MKPKNLVLLFVMVVFMAGTVLAQTPKKAVAKAGIGSAKKAPAPVASKAKPKAKTPKGKAASKVKTSGDMEFEEIVCYEDGPCTFNILKGDTLVYEVNAPGKQYNLMIVPNKFDANTIADFNWKTTAPDSKSGHVVINTSGMNNAKSYMATLPAGELKLTDASSVWLSNNSFKEISKGQSLIAIDNGAQEAYSSPEVDAVAQPVNYKGKDLTLEGFAIQSKPEGQPDRKEMWILNVSSNLLILKMDTGSWTMALKEVRKRK
jgi:hypothetical protein